MNHKVSVADVIIIDQNKHSKDCWHGPDPIKFSTLFYVNKNFITFFTKDNLYSNHEKCNSTIFHYKYLTLDLKNMFYNNFK